MPDLLENAVDKCLKGSKNGSVVCLPGDRKRMPSREREPAPGARPRGPFPRGVPPEWTANEEFEAALACKQATVIGSNSGRVYTGTSLFCLAPGNQPRKTAIRIVESRPFDPIILLTIAVRCLSVESTCTALVGGLCTAYGMCTTCCCLGTALKPRPFAHGRPGCQPSSSCRLTRAPASHNGVHRAWAFRRVPPTPCPLQANCATMAWESPLDEMLHPEGTWKSSFIGVCEWAYLGIFTFELLTKVLAYGFLWHREAYLRDAWCQLDFVVVTLAWAPILFPSMGNYSVIRSFRALRPLRALKRMPGMPKLAAAACWKRRPGHSSPQWGAGLLWALGGTRLWAGAHGPHRAHRREGRPQCGCEPGPISPTWRDP